MGWVTDVHPTTEELDACVQCGLCLPACPTFRLTGRETASPRGRLHAMRAVHAGSFEVDETFAEIIDGCLGCRACEPVCPGLVPYGRALEGARAELVAQRSSVSHRIRSWALGSTGVLRFGGRMLSGAVSMRLTGLAPTRFSRLAKGLRRDRGRGAPSQGYTGGTGERGTVALLSGCVQDVWFRPVNRAAIELIELAGYRVEAPASQECCGALAAHDGKAGQARELASSNVGVFERYDTVIATSAGCSAHMREYGHWTEREIGWEALDVTVFVARAIADGLLPELPASGVEVGIQDPCHLRHAQRVVEEPRNILSAAGYDVVEIDPAGMCCGAAGLYTVLQPEISEQLGNSKADQIRSSGVTRVASANPGCEMQMRAFVGDDVEIAHPIEWYLNAIKQRGSAINVAAVRETP